MKQHTGADAGGDADADLVPSASAVVHPMPNSVAPALASRSRPWREWLAGGSAREVLARIVPEDPLGVREHVARALRDGCFLLDAQRVALRCFALVARHSVRYRGRPELDEWLQILARESVAAILRDDTECERRPSVPGREPGREHGEAFRALARPLGLEPGAMGRACLAFNRLTSADRGAFFALVIASRPLDELVRESGESATEIARRARRALDILLAASALAGASSAPSASQPASAGRASGARSPATKSSNGLAAQAESQATGISAGRSKSPATASTPSPAGRSVGTAEGKPVVTTVGKAPATLTTKSAATPLGKVAANPARRPAELVADKPAVTAAGKSPSTRNSGRGMAGPARERGPRDGDANFESKRGR